MRPFCIFMACVSAALAVTGIYLLVTGDYSNGVPVLITGAANTVTFAVTAGEWGWR